MATKKQTQIVKITRTWQILFMLAMIASWLSPVIFLALWASGGYMSRSTWIFQISYTVLPFVFFTIALVAIWNNYRSTFERLFFGVFIATIGYTLYGCLSSLENVIRYKFFTPVISDTNDTGLLTAFGHEWLVMSIGVIIFGAVLLIRNIKRR